MNRNKKLTRILSIDGGGIRGILPGQVLVALENKLRLRTGNPDARLADFFDLLAGTSTGGILTCLLLTPSTEVPSRPRFGAEEAVALYLQNGSAIFDVPLWHGLRTVRGILNARYPAKAIESVIQGYLGDLKLSELVKPCLITSYDVQRCRPKFFTQHNALEGLKRGNLGHDFYVREVARATSAAPTYFPAANVTSLSGVHYPLIDGGIFANNPTLCAYAEARQMDFGEEKIHPNAADMLILSLGTGNNSTSYEYQKIRNWGIAEWIQPLIDMMMNGVSQTVDYQLRQMYDAVGTPHQYIRIDPIFGDAKPSMDDASEQNLKALAAAGIETAEIHDATLDRVVDMLIANA
ncbi:patatin-like phospholipase family protein [Eisenibacter elegans]|jgi:patatin-like phospholipase/acyl hydrolase|uniref:patatin-like phospholipase family protein n=1 Tax=Eisenibacter elegans TaxID=997 RepID=UPI0004105697|nr:patatin-like phospholipase family protein [Eisenibacter elegans]